MSLLNVFIIINKIKNGTPNCPSENFSLNFSQSLVQRNNVSVFKSVILLMLTHETADSLEKVTNDHKESILLNYLVGR